MSCFTDEEIEYLQSQRLGRLATVNNEGKPHNVPVTFRYNKEMDTIDIGGYNMTKSKKFRDIAENENIAFVVDDILPPWKPRFVEIRGKAVQVRDETQASEGFDPDFIRIYPTKVITRGLHTDESGTA